MIKKFILFILISLAVVNCSLEIGGITVVNNIIVEASFFDGNMDQLCNFLNNCDLENIENLLDAGLPLDAEIPFDAEVISEIDADAGAIIEEVDALDPSTWLP